MDQRILIVDDDSSILFALERYFRMFSYDVDTAWRLDDALALLAANRYAVLIVDLQLTGAECSQGLDIVRTARRLSPETRVVLQTGHATQEVEAEARQCGVDAFLPKPTPLVEVGSVVRELLAQSVRHIRHATPTDGTDLRRASITACA